MRKFGRTPRKSYFLSLCPLPEPIYLHFTPNIDTLVILIAECSSLKEGKGTASGEYTDNREEGVQKNYKKPLQGLTCI